MDAKKSEAIRSLREIREQLELLRATEKKIANAKSDTELNNIFVATATAAKSAVKKLKSLKCSLRSSAGNASLKSIRDEPSSKPKNANNESREDCVNGTTASHDYDSNVSSVRLRDSAASVSLSEATFETDCTVNGNAQMIESEPATMESLPTIENSCIENIQTSNTDSETMNTLPTIESTNNCDVQISDSVHETEKDLLANEKTGHDVGDSESRSGILPTSEVTDVGTDQVSMQSVQSSDNVVDASDDAISVLDGNDYATTPVSNGSNTPHQSHNKPLEAAQDNSMVTSSRNADDRLETPYNDLTNGDTHSQQRSDNDMFSTNGDAPAPTTNDVDVKPCMIGKIKVASFARILMSPNTSTVVISSDSEEEPVKSVVKKASRISESPRPRAQSSPKSSRKPVGIAQSIKRNDTENRTHSTSNTSTNRSHTKAVEERKSSQSETEKGLTSNVSKKQPERERNALEGDSIALNSDTESRIKATLTQKTSKDSKKIALDVSTKKRSEEEKNLQFKPRSSLKSSDHIHSKRVRFSAIYSSDDSSENDVGNNDASTKHVSDELMLRAFGTADLKLKRTCVVNVAQMRGEEMKRFVIPVYRPSSSSDSDSAMAPRKRSSRRQQLKRAPAPESSDSDVEVVPSKPERKRETSSRKKSANKVQVKVESDVSFAVGSDSDGETLDKKIYEAGSESDNDKKKNKETNQKKTKKRPVLSDSDYEKNSDNSDNEVVDKNTDDSDEDSKAKPPRRKRIRRNKDSSSEDEGKKEKPETRKQIRRIINKDNLEQSTLEAEEDEIERKRRIAEKQKKYNEIFNIDDLENASMEKVVLDIDEDTNEEVLSVAPFIVKHLKPHQGKGIQFMWNACFESIERAQNSEGSGCILAHCMGLGKTLQVIGLAHTLLENYEQTRVSKVMVVCPLSTVLNWVAEFKKWIADDDRDFEVYDLVSGCSVSERGNRIADWHNHGGVMIIGYDMFRNLSNATNKRIVKKTRTIFLEGLVDPGPDVVICDEGHLLKNEKTSISIAMNRIRSMRRIVLTGTPLQNNLKEYWCMVQFVKPNLLGTYKEYLNRFVNPITNGQYTDSTHSDIQIMRKRSHVLHKLLDGIVQRRDYGVLAPYLPPKHEFVIFVTLTSTQIQLYDTYLQRYARQVAPGATRGVSLFKDFQAFQRICTHPRVLLDKSIEDANARWKHDEENDTEGSEGSLNEFIDDDDDEEAVTTPEVSSDDDGSSDDGKRKKKKKAGTAAPAASTSRVRTTRATAAEQGIEVSAVASLEEASTGSEWWREFTEGDVLNNIAYSSKLSLLFEILQQCETIGDKILIFSQSLYSLNVIEYFLAKIDEATQNEATDVNGYSGSWSLGLDYFRLDGSSSCDNRAYWCKTFNDPKNLRARLFLISTRAGGLGINLVAANRVIIFDVSWNPSHDIQSIYRVYRFGQTKPSFIYRFVTNGTMEMKVYERQVTKQAVSKRVIDEQQIDRHYNQNDLTELYKFEPIPQGERPTPLVPKDVLLGELVNDNPKLIYKYHEHHTLLENKEDEVLNEAERKAAWDEFEHEKKVRQLPAHVNNIPMNTIMTFMTLQLRKEHPEWSLEVVKNEVPKAVLQMIAEKNAGIMTKYNKILEDIRQQSMVLQHQQQQQANERARQQQLQLQLLQDMYRYQQNANPNMNPNPYFTTYPNTYPNSSLSTAMLAQMLAQTQYQQPVQQQQQQPRPRTQAPETINID